MSEKQERRLNLVKGKEPKEPKEPMEPEEVNPPHCGETCKCNTDVQTNVFEIADAATDGSMWTPDGMVRFAMKDHAEEPADKAFLILLNDNDEKFFPRWYNCKLKLSEAIALLEVVKSDLATMLLYGGE